MSMSLFLPQTMPRRTLPPSMGKAGMRLKAARTKLMYPAYWRTATTARGRKPPTR